MINLDIIISLEEKIDNVLNNLIVLNIITKSLKINNSFYDVLNNDIQYKLYYNYRNIKTSIKYEEIKIYKLEKELKLLMKYINNHN